MRLRPQTGLALLLALPATVLGADILKTTGYSTCLDNADITVENVNIAYDRAARKITFDVAGSSAKEQKVTASLTVVAYGKEVYTKDFDPCDEATKVDQLCPVPVGRFGAKGTQDVPQNFADQIPSIAFQVPDLDGTAKLTLKAKDGGQDLACIQSQVGNGKTIETKGVQYVAVGIAGAALVLSGLSALGSGSGSGAPGFAAVLTWMQSIATNGMMSVNYPPVYRSFSKNFAFSSGLIPWGRMQISIDNFRKSTGGNLTDNSYTYLQNATLVFTDDGSPVLDANGSAPVKRGLASVYSGLTFLEHLHARDLAVDIHRRQEANETSSDKTALHPVYGIQAYAEKLGIPEGNTFMTILLFFLVVIAAIALSILLFKVILEAWALFASFPKKLTGFRKRYWGLMGRTIVNLILIIYGIWTLFCIFYLVHGDSWATRLLAGLSLALFTAVLGFFTFKIWSLARRYKKMQGDPYALYDNKQVWIKYSLFYDQYKKDLWWIFIPTIIYMFARGSIIAGGDGHGMVQTAGQLIVEALLLILLLWKRPYIDKTGNVIHICIQIVRALSVCCILVFVEQLRVPPTAKSIMGVVLVVVQTVLTAILGILIAVNAIIVCVRANPHRQQRKEAEKRKMSRDLDNLTPLDARNSLLQDPGNNYPNDPSAKGPLMSEHSVRQSPNNSGFFSRSFSVKSGFRRTR